jgi:hypothetical protein
MSTCIHREKESKVRSAEFGVWNKKRKLGWVCRANKKPCPWWRAMICIPVDGLKAIGKMLLE